MADPTNLSRRMTLSNIVQAITTYGPISRASVAKMTGYSKQTVSEIVSSLEEDGWVQTVGRTEGNVGRRAVVYEIVPDAALVASVDLGGTKVRVALCNLSGGVVAEAAEPTCKDGGEAVVDQIARMVNGATSNLGIAPSKIRVAVIGVPGVPDLETGHINLAPNIIGIDRIDFSSLLRVRLGIEVIVENDVNLAALGEHWMTHQGDKDDLVFLSIGTGIGAGVVIGGQLVRGATGGAGEVGFIPFGADPTEPESLKVGALERVTATTAIVGGYRQETGMQKTVPEIFDAFVAGEEAAANVLQTTASYIARTIGAIAALIDPNCVVIGGSIGAREELIRMIEQEIARNLPRAIPVEASALGNHAALAGGTAVALSRLHIALFARDLPGANIVVPPPEIETFQEGAA
ncbi:ROK family transcriptional regulator [uncultured Ruegeria sp.]|uniref:ROK family transcriptional regulator n=1 Tax=uncultured Ruegeria sp. TaxID=259304 RepID=UPI00261FBEB9|nr:ROK family transcriptional regulator [uncultured Ruegeria sp.]